MNHSKISVVCSDKNGNLGPDLELAIRLYTDNKIVHYTSLDCGCEDTARHICHEWNLHKKFVPLDSRVSF